MGAANRFQVDLHGIIDLLSHHLYSGPQVYVREALQNAVDAISARRGEEPGHAGEVRLELSGGATPTIVVADDGIGLTADDVHRFLATIGESSKRDVLDRRDFIGQFGIGLLSCFLVSDEIVVVTRSVSGAPTVEWRGRADGTYEIRELDSDAAAGTQVFLRAKPGMEELFEPEFVLRAARRFGSALPIRVVVEADGATTEVNETPVWLQDDVDEQLAYAGRVFDEEFLDAVPLRAAAGGVEGVAFVLARPLGPAAKRSHRVYVKNMLLSERADNLLPDWAFFVKSILNANDLRPTASREALYEDETLAAAREELGAELRRYLVRLGREAPHRLERLIGVHALAFKALAVDDDEFFEIVVDLLPFETSLGTMPLGEYLQRVDRIRYVPTRDEFRQIAAVASAEGLSVVNGGYTYDTELLEKLAHVFPDRDVERVDAAELAATFEPLSLDERDEVHDLLRWGDVALQPFRCSLDVRRFKPETLPALYTANEAASFVRSVDQSKEIADELWASVLDSVSEDAAQSAYAELCLNYESPLVRKLASIRDRTLVAESVAMLYVQSLLLGHHALRARELALLSDGLLRLIARGVEAG